MTYEERQVISAEVDAKIELFATPVTAEEAAKLRARGVEIVFHPRDLMKQNPMKRIGESDEITDKQIVAFLDDQQMTAKIEGATKIKVRRRRSRGSARRTRAARRRVERACTS